MICKICARAADIGNSELGAHSFCKGCDCHHKPIEGQPLTGQNGKGLDAEAVAEAFNGNRARICLHCDKVVALNKDGRMRKHNVNCDRRHPCPGSGIKHD